MKLLYIILIMNFCTYSYAQQQGNKKPIPEKSKTEIQSIQNQTVDTTLINDAKSIKEDLKNDVKSIKDEASEKLKSSKPNTPGINDANDASKEQKEKLINQHKLEDLQYDSDNPENAPWKNKKLSTDDFKSLTAPDVNGNLNVPSAGDKPDKYKEKVNSLRPDNFDSEAVKEKLSNKKGFLNNKKFEKVTDLADSVLTLKDELELTKRKDLLAAMPIYSDKFKKKLYDSLGGTKADSIFGVVGQFAKTATPKEEMLSRINSKIESKTNGTGVGFDSENQSLKFTDADKISGLQKQFKQPDLSTLQLDRDALAELPPLSGIQMDSKYLPLIDSIREVAMKAKNFNVDEREVTEEVKHAVLKRTPKFKDRTYFEGILSAVNDSTFSIVQISPSVGYHFTSYLSLGLGPVVSVELQDKKIHGVVGFRSFIKAEFYRQRGYFQVEDNMQQVRTDVESVKSAKHSILVGGGVVLPLFKKLGINAGVFYRVNQQQVSPNGSPWVFRIGLSSIKQINQD